MPEEDPFLKVQRELSEEELPDLSRVVPLEDRLRAKLEDIAVTPSEDVEAMMEAMTSKVSHAASPDDPTPPDFDARLRALEEKSTNVRRDREVAKFNKERKILSDSQSAAGLGVGMSVAYAILGAPLLGALIGYFLDKQFHSNLYTGALTLLGAIIGVLYAILTIKEKGNRL